MAQGRPSYAHRAIADEWAALEAEIEAVVPLPLLRRIERPMERFGDHLAEFRERMDRSIRLTNAPPEWAKRGRAA